MATAALTLALVDSFLTPFKKLGEVKKLIHWLYLPFNKMKI